MCICAGLVGPKIENMHATAARSRFLKGQMRGDVVRQQKYGSLGPNPGSLWSHFGVSLPTLESLWDYFGYINVSLE